MREPSFSEPSLCIPDNPLPPVRSDALLAVLGPLLDQACCLLDNVNNRDTPQWQAALALFRAQLKDAEVRHE